MTTHEETCRNCYYWRWLDDDFGTLKENLVSGWCRRYPKQYLGKTEDEDSRSHDEWGHPVTLHHHWCGEWKQYGVGASYRPLQDDLQSSLSGASMFVRRIRSPTKSPMVTSRRAFFRYTLEVCTREVPMTTDGD